MATTRAAMTTAAARFRFLAIAAVIWTLALISFAVKHPDTALDAATASRIAGL